MKSKIPLNIFVCLLYYTCSSQSLSTHYLGGGANNACSFFITDMKMSNKGSCYFTGGYYLDAQIDTFIMSAPIGYGNFFLSKISGGHINYLKYDLNFYENHSNCMAIDDSSNIYIGGRYYGDIILGNDTLPAGPFAIGLFIAKYDSAANLKWAKTFYTGSGNINDIAVTSQGDIYAGGYFGGTLKFDNDSLTSTSNYQEAFICKFNNSGNYQWAIEGHGILQNKFVDAVAADTAGNVYIAGYFTNSITFGSVTINSTVLNNPIGYLVKLSPSGTVLFYKKLESFTFMGNAVVPSDIEVVTFAPGQRRLGWWFATRLPAR